MNKKQLIEYRKKLEKEIKEFEKEIYDLANHINTPDPNLGNEWEGSDMQYNVKTSKFKTGLGEKLPDDYVFKGRIDRSLPLKYFDEEGNLKIHEKNDPMPVKKEIIKIKK